MVISREDESIAKMGHLGCKQIRLVKLFLEKFKKPHGILNEITVFLPNPLSKIPIPA